MEEAEEAEEVEEAEEAVESDNACNTWWFFWVGLPGNLWGLGFPQAFLSLKAQLLPLKMQMKLVILYSESLNCGRSGRRGRSGRSGRCGRIVREH